MSIEGLLRLHGHDTRKVVQPDGTLEFVPAAETGAAVTDLNRAAAPLTVEEIRESFRATGNYLSEVLHIDPCGDAIVDALEPLFPDIAESMIPAKSFERSEAENRLKQAQLNLAAARDAGDQRAMLSAHDAVERAAAEVASQ